MTEQAMTIHRYQSFYCEENIWHLCHEDRFQDKDTRVVFISNPMRACPMMSMKAAELESEPVFWDYHVIFIDNDSEWRVWDLDTRLGLPTEPETYLTKSFSMEMPEFFAPIFRVVETRIFLDLFSSDRRHMIEASGAWIEPPPDWPPIYNGSSSNLDRFTDMESEFAGTVMDLSGFRSLLKPGPKPQV